MSVHPFAESFNLEAAFGSVSEYWSPKIIVPVPGMAAER